MCTVLLPPGGYPIAVKYIISYRFVTLPLFWRRAWTVLYYSMDSD